MCCCCKLTLPDFCQMGCWSFAGSTLLAQKLLLLIAFMLAIWYLLPRDDTQHEKSRTLIRKENIKFEYKFEIRISKNLTIAYHIKFLKCRSSWFFLQHLFRIFDTNTWIHFVIFSYSTIPLEIINIPIKILVITHTWRQTEKSWRLLLNCEFRELCAQMYNFC